MSDPASDGPNSPTNKNFAYDVAIVGAGISGCEAAAVCARAGLGTLLVTTSLDTIYNLVSDSALLAPPEGTLMAELLPSVAADGGAVRRWALHRAAKYALERLPGLHLLQSNVSRLMVTHGRVVGVETWEGVPRTARATALCVGGFLRARLHVGELTEVAGRLGEMAYDDLYDDLVGHGLSFETLRCAVDLIDLRYELECRVLAAGERAPGSYRVTRLRSLFAAGLCAAGASGALLTHEAAAADGVALGRELVACLSSSASP